MAEENELLRLLRSTAQGANNNIAGNVAIPVDLLAKLLQGAGVSMPANPMGGTQWQQQQGLLAQPENRMAGLLGDAAGALSPMGLKRPVGLLYP